MLTMKKILLAVLVLVMLAGAALAQETARFSFATLGDAMASESYTGIASGDDQRNNYIEVLIVTAGDACVAFRRHCVA